VTDVDIETSFPTTTDPIQSATVTDLLPAVSAHSIEAAAARATFPPASSLTRFRRRIKRLHQKPAVKEPVDTTPVVIERIEEPIEQAPIRKIELPQPDEDIPTMEDVAAALSETPISFVDLQDKSAPVVASRAVVVSPPVEDIPPPSFAALPVARSSKIQPEKVVVPQRAKAAKASAGSSTKAAAAAAPLLDEEEITVVRPPSKPIRINIESPRPSRPQQQRAGNRVPASSQQLTYVPTLLGSSPVNKEPAAPASLFGSYQPPKRINLRGRGQNAAIVAGILVAASVFLFNTDSLWQQTHSLASSEQPSTEHSTAERPEHSTVSPAPQTADLKDVKEKAPIVSTDQKSAKSEPKPRAINSEVVSEPPPATKEKAKPAAPIQISQKPTALKSVSNEKLFQTQRIEIPRRSSSSSSATETNKPTATTRPRIVRAP